MKNKRVKSADRKRRQKNKRIDGMIVLVFLILAGSVIWLGVNGLNKEKTDGTTSNETKPTTDFEEVNGSSESDTPAKGNDQVTSSNEIGGPENEPLRKPEESPVVIEAPEEGMEETENPTESTAEEKAEQTTPSNPIGYIEGQQLPKNPKFVNGVVLANKQYPLPADYAPGESEEARAEFEKLAAASKTAGINLQAFSTYRPYDYQVTLYERYVARDGQKEADRYSARPGYSEHQTGLAFDIGEVNHEKHWASNSFSDTEAAKWLAANAHRYGFILRYPEGKEEITGYMHEAWHYRYVGKDMAEEIFKRNITLEEYLGVR